MTVSIQEHSIGLIIRQWATPELLYTPNSPYSRPGSDCRYSELGPFQIIYHGGPFSLAQLLPLRFRSTVCVLESILPVVSDVFPASDFL